MKPLTWQGVEDVRIDTVPDPTIREPTDAIVRITSTAICGSDLHLYKLLGMFIDDGDVLGHEPMGIVQEVSARRPRCESTARGLGCSATPSSTVRFPAARPSTCGTCGAGPTTSVERFAAPLPGR